MVTGSYTVADPDGRIRTVINVLSVGMMAIKMVAIKTMVMVMMAMN